MREEKMNGSDRKNPRPVRKFKFNLVIFNLLQQVFDKDGSGKVPLPEIKNVLCSLGEKLDNPEADKLCDLLGIVAVSLIRFY